MEYIAEILGVNVERMTWNQADKLPYLLLNEYRFEVVKIGSTQSLFLKPAGELAAINVVKKHLKLLGETCALPVVFELDSISRQRRISFIEARIAFVIPGKQIYLPFLGIWLQERCDSEEAIVPILEKLQPSAQMLLFAFIIGGNTPTYLADMTKRFGFSAMTLSRAANQLTQAGLIRKDSDGIRIVLSSGIKPKELYQKAAPYLIDPIRKTIYIDKTERNAQMFPSGLSALADRSMLNPPVPEVWGTVQFDKAISNTSARLIDGDKQCALQLWKYDPRLISGEGKVDALSLAVSLKDITDERVEQMLDDILREVW